MPSSSTNPEPELYCVELRTSQWGEMVRWYREALQLAVKIRVAEDEYALLSAGGTRIAIMGRRQPGESSSRWSLAFEVANIATAYERLTRSGSHPGKPKPHEEGFLYCECHDPDGNRIRLFQWPED